MTIESTIVHRPRCSKRQYYVLTTSAKFTQVLSWLGMHNSHYEVHLNRTRFTLDTTSRLHTEFMLLYSDAIGVVDPSVDLVTGG